MRMRQETQGEWGAVMQSNRVYVVYGQFHDVMRGGKHKRPETLVRVIVVRSVFYFMDT